MIEEYTAAEFQKAMNTIEGIYFHSYSSQKSPKAYLICGQPGAGKSYLVAHLKDKSIAFINGDEYRYFHPHIQELREALGEKYMEATRSFNGKMTEALIDDLSDKRINLMIEGTLRTIDVPVKTKNLLEKKGYDVTLCVLVIRPEISYLRAKQRYVDMKKLGVIPRSTDVSFQQNITDGLISNLDAIYKRNEFKEIKLFGSKNNELELLYCLEKTPTINPSHVVYQEHHKLYEPAEVDRLAKNFSEVITPNDFASLLAGKLERADSK